MSARGDARKAIAKVAFDVVEGAPMIFIADPDIPLLMAELQIRALLELGWTPPAEAPEPTAHQCERWQEHTKPDGSAFCGACGVTK